MVSFYNPFFADATRGQPYGLSWIDATGPVTINLKNGSSTELKTVLTITGGQTGNSYTWDIPSSLEVGTYALEILDVLRVPSYSTQFQMIGGTVSSSSGTSTQSSIITSTTRFSDSTTSVLSSIPSSSKFSATQPTSPTIESATSSSYIPPTDSPLPNPKSSLSSGAKAGVGVGITLGVLLVLGTAAFFFWFGKRIASRKTNQRQDSIDNGSVPSEVEGKPVPVCPQELEGLSLPAELPEKRFKRWTRLDNQYQDIDEAEVDDR